MLWNAGKWIIITSPHSSLDYQTPAAYADQYRAIGCTRPDRQAVEMKNMAETLS